MAEPLANLKIWDDGALIGSGQWLGTHLDGTWELDWYDEDAEDSFKKILESEWDAAYSPVPDGQTAHPPKDIFTFESMLAELGFEISLDIIEAVTI